MFLSYVALVILVFQVCHTLNDDRRSSRAKVKVRLNRAVTNNQWHDLFLEVGVKHLVAPSSDHAPILLRCFAELPWENVGRGATAMKLLGSVTQRCLR